MLLAIVAVGLPIAFPGPAAAEAEPAGTQATSAAQEAAAGPRAAPVDAVPPDAELAARGAVIGEIRIQPENIFDIADPKEDNWLFRLANRLHIRTRKSTIANQLLFKTGDPFNPRLLEESERILRSNGYLYDARIRPAAFRDGRVDIDVVTRDVWTLRPGFSFGRKGGQNTTSIDFEETNFLGRGSKFRIASTSTPERKTNSVEFSDGHLFGTRLRTGLLYSESDDGRKRSALLEYPFYALDSRWAGGASGVDDERIDSFPARIGIASSYSVREKLLRAYGGYSPGLSGGWVRRWALGATRDESRFSIDPNAPSLDPPPADRVLVYPWIGFELLEDRFEQARNRDQIERTEDFFLGTRVAVTLGYASPDFGADRSAVVHSLALAHSLEFGEKCLVTLNGKADGRVQRGAARSTALGAAAHQYYRLAEKWLFFAFLSGDRLLRPDDDRQLDLGGENGLRGYPSEYQVGDRRFLLTLEQRFYTPYYPFRLFRIGGAFFFDVGRAWGGPFRSAADPGILKDVGAGLRIGNARSALGNVIHVDVAFPLDGDPTIARVQFLVVTRQSF